MSLKFYGYDGCSTCRKAKKWLESHKVDFDDIAIVDNPPSKGELKKYLETSGLESRKFFNTSGQVYREKKLGEKLPSLSDSERLEMLAGNGKLIKRPLLVGKDFVLVGFDEAAYKKTFK